MSDESTKKDGEGTPAAEEAKEEATSKSAEGAEAKSEAKADEAKADEAEAKAEEKADEKDEAAEAKDEKAEEPPVGGAKVSISEKPPAKADAHHEATKAAHDHEGDHGDHDDHGHGDGHIAYDDQGPLVAEPDRPRAGIITAITIGIMLTVAVSCALIWSYYVTRFQAEVDAKQGNIEDPALRDLRALETARLTKYQWVKQEAGIVRIPVARAKELVLKDYEKVGPYVPKAPVSLEPPKEPAKVEEPSPAPAPSASASTAASAAASTAASGSAAPPAGSTSAAPSASAPKHQH